MRHLILSSLHPRQPQTSLKVHSFGVSTAQRLRLSSSLGNWRVRCWQEGLRVHWEDRKVYNTEGLHRWHFLFHFGCSDKTKTASIKAWGAGGSNGGQFAPGGGAGGFAKVNCSLCLDVNLFFSCGRPMLLESDSR